MNTIEEQLREKIAELKSELANYEEALTLIAPEPKKVNTAGFNTVPFNKDPEKALTVNAALLKALADGPLSRKDIISAIEALRPGTTGQTVSSALNGLKRGGNVKLNK